MEGFPGLKGNDILPPYLCHCPQFVFFKWSQGYGLFVHSAVSY